LPTAESLQGKTIGYMQGTIQETYAKAKLAPGGVKLRAYQNQDQVYADLVFGRLDASNPGQDAGANELFDFPSRR
jgi:histidine transport system substrate-binding protein